MTGLLILAGAGVAYIALHDRPEFKQMVESIRARLADLTAPEPTPDPIPPPPTPEQETAIAMRGGTWEELAASGLTSFVETGGAITGDESVDEILAQGGGAYLVGGPLAGALVAGLTIVAQQDAMMEEVAAWRAIRFMVSPGQEAEQRKRKKKSESCPSVLDCPKLDPSVHKRLHAYEVKMTDYYMTEAGRADFKDRLTRTLAGEGNFLASWGWSWLGGQGVDIAEVQANIPTLAPAFTPEELARVPAGLLRSVASKLTVADVEARPDLEAGLRAYM